jgi:hypothetical protein
MAWLFVLGLLSLTQAHASVADSVRLYLGPVPAENGIVAPAPQSFKDSYADLKRVSSRAAKLYSSAHSPAPFTLVEDVPHADVILTVIQRGPGTADEAHHTPTLVARLTVRRTGDTEDFSGIAPGTTDRRRWTEQAEDIYRQVAAWADRNHEALVRLRAGL